MGLNYPTGALLAWSVRKRGLKAKNIVTIGKLEVNMSASQLRRIHKYMRLKEFDGEHNKWSADQLLSFWLQAAEVKSLDVSDYQGASIVHDLNNPVPDDLFACCDLLIDGGCLEHVFNVPVALVNYSKMVRLGGHVLIATTANNYMGHGFYQFSPELFFSYFSKAKGFMIEYVGLAVHPFPSSSLSTGCQLYEVTDPTKAKGRIGLVSSTPALILILVKRISVENTDSENMIQSDYISLHENNTKVGRAEKVIVRLIKNAVKALFPTWFVMYLKGMKELRWYSLRNKKAFRKHTLENWEVS